MSFNQIGKTVTTAANPGFISALHDVGGCLCVSMYQAGKIAVLGVTGSRLSVLLRDFDRPMGVAYADSTLAIGTREAVLLLRETPVDFVSSPERQPRHDVEIRIAATVPTGDISGHDLAFDAAGDLCIVNTRFSCLMRVSASREPTITWRPPFISQLRPEDRCHLNGVAMVDGQPRFATSLGQSDLPNGWRPNRAAGGCLFDLKENEILASNLCMPHSPRWHQQQLWLLNSGRGELLRWNASGRNFNTVTCLPGYLRGMCMIGNYAFVGLGRIRSSNLTLGLPVQARFPELRCGVSAIDIRSGATVGWFEFTDGCDELFEVCHVPTWKQPLVLNPTA